MKKLLSLFFILIFSSNCFPAVSFDGIDDYISVPNPGSVLNGKLLTVTAWIYPQTSANTYPRIVDRVYNGQFAFYFIDSAGLSRLSFAISTVGGAVDRAGGSPGNGSLPLNSWHFVAMTYDGTFVRTYVDCINWDTYSGTISGGLSNSSSEMRIGARVDGGAARNIKGKLDDVRIYNRPLSIKELLLIFNSRGRLNITNGLVAYYRLNDGRDSEPIGGQKVRDFSGNRFNGNSVAHSSWSLANCGVLRYP